MQGDANAAARGAYLVRLDTAGDEGGTCPSGLVWAGTTEVLVDDDPQPEVFSNREPRNSRLPNGRVALLFTDVEGSTRLLRRLGESYAAALADHRAVLRTAVAAHHGVEVDTQGDACFFAFTSAAEAVAAAVDAQAALLAGSPVRVRMGLHCGTPTVTAEGYVGIDIHLGARIAAVAHGGQVVMSSEVASEVALPVQYLGHHRMKDFDEATSLFQAGTDAFPPLRTLANTNLPRPVSALIGRSDDVSHLVALLNGGVRFLTLTGPGGTGKTRLALEAAAEVLPSFIDGVFWVPLESISDPSFVAETIRRTVGAHGELASHFEEKHVLLLLDNLEHLTAAAPMLADLVEETRHLALLVTSRELLCVRGEIEFPVAPLARADAVRLFCDLASVEADDDVRQICDGLDGLPLAVEIAAARARIFSPSHIKQQLSHRLDFHVRRRDAHPRQHTLRETIRWSFDLLEPDERQVLTRMSVFPAGCTLEGAGAVGGATPDTLASLLDKSLVRSRQEGEVRRFWMLDTIRQFASEELIGDGNLDETELRLGRYLERILTTNAGVVWQDTDARRTLAAEHANILAALEWSHQAGEERLFLSLVDGCCDLWVILGHVRLGGKWVSRALAVSVMPDARRARLLLFAATFAYQSNDLDAATRFGEDAVGLASQIGDDRVHALAVNQLANARNAAGDARSALELYREARRLAQASADKDAEGVALVNIATILASEQQFHESRESSTGAIALFRERNNLPGVASALVTFGQAALGESDTDGARPAIRDAIRYFAEMRHPQWLARCIDCVAMVSALDGEALLAAELLAAATALREADGLSLSPVDRSVHDRAHELVGGELPATELARATREGRSIPLERVLQRALSRVN